MKKVHYLAIFICVLAACNTPKKSNLPFLGERYFNGKDTVYASIPAFHFIDQDSQVITEKTFVNKIYVADFIFLSCGGICPKMTTQMMNLYQEYKNNPNVVFISHSIDTENDKVPQLKIHATKLEVLSDKWHFVTGEEDSIYTIAENHYYASVKRDSSAPGGLIHSGGLILVDKNRHVRGIYDGTAAGTTGQLIIAIEQLLKEE